MSTDPSIVLRRAEAGEAGAIRDLVRAAYAKWVPLIGREPRPMQADYEAMLRTHRFDVAVASGQIMGLIETDLREEHLWIENVAVRPEAQGHGTGTLLLVHAESLAQAAGRQRIALLTNAAFEANLKLYRRLGYATDREETYMGGTTVYMSKVIV